LWLRHHLFECDDTNYESQELSTIYAEALQCGEKYTRFIDALPPAERLQEIRRFRSLPYEMKRQYINLLP
ncbi:MAG: hypothetical protein ACRENG_18240, partial [bacterium]